MFRAITTAGKAHISGLLQKRQEDIMYTGIFFTELIVKERQRKWIAEADRLRHIKAIKSKKWHGRKQTLDTISGYIKTLGAVLFRKNEGLTCKC